MRIALDVRIRQGKYSSFVRVTELLQQAAASVDLDLELWNGGECCADVLWNPLMDPAPVPDSVAQILTLHDFSPLLEDPRSAFARWRRARRFRQRVKASALRASAFSAVSEHVASLAQEFLPDGSAPVSVVPHFPASSFVPLDFIAQQEILEPLQLQPGFVLFVAALRQHKNWQGVMRSWLDLPAKLRAQHPLVFAGSKGRGQAQLERMLRAVQSPDVVHVLDTVDDPTLSALYSACSVMVFPSFNEGFGLPPLEAMACGAPVVASNLTAMPEVLGDAALLIDPWSTDAIRDAMQSILTDPAIASARRQASLTRAADFSARRTGEAMRSLLVDRGFLQEA